MYLGQNALNLSAGLVFIIQVSSLVVLQNVTAAAEFTLICINSSYLILLIKHLWTWIIKPFINRPSARFAIGAVSYFAAFLDQSVEVYSFIHTYTSMPKYSSQLTRFDFTLLVTAVGVHLVALSKDAKPKDTLKILSLPILFSQLIKVVIVTIYNDASVSDNYFWGKAICLLLVRLSCMLSVFYYVQYFGKEKFI